MKIRRALVLLACCFTAFSTQAGPPFVTDDPELPPPGGWEINVPFILEYASGATEMDAPLFDLNYGLPDIQLKLEFRVAIIHEDNNGTQPALGDSLVGVKWRFLNDEHSHFQLGTYPQLLLPDRRSRAQVWSRTEWRSYCRCSHRKAGINGRFTATSGIGGKARTKRQLLLCGCRTRT